MAMNSAYFHWSTWGSYSILLTLTHRRRGRAMPVSSLPKLNCYCIIYRRPSHPLALLYDHLLPCKCLVPSHHKSISYPKFIKIHNTLLRPPPPALPPQQTCELTPAPQMAPSHMSLQHTDQTLQHAFMGDVASQEGEKQDRASDSEAPKPRHQFSVSEEGLDEGAAGRGHGEEGQGGCCCCMCRRASVIERECAQ